MGNEMAVLQKDITDVVLGKVSELESQGVQLPRNYNAANALKQAFFKINEVQLSKNEGGSLYMVKYGNTPIGKASIANSLLDMIQQGLNPGKNQCYFIAYGQKLQMSRSYFGTQAALKRLDEIEDVKAEVIRKGDVFKIGSVDNETVVTEFEPCFENMDNEIIGAFATITKTDGAKVYTIMTKKQIDKSWSKAKVKAVQIDFPEEMAKRTVINRAAKPFINTSDDSELFSDAFNRTTENEYDREIKQAEPVKVQAIENKLQRKMGIKQAEPVEQDHTVEDLMKPKETIEQEPEEQYVDLESLEEADPVQEDLGIIPNFDREEGADDEGILKEEDYPF